MVWSYIIQLSIVATAMLIGSFLRAKVRFLQKFLIPSPMIAGFLLLIFYNTVGLRIGFTNEFLDSLVYHLLNISFISMMLRIPEKKEKGSKGMLVQNTASLAFQYGIQVFLGLLLTFILMKTFYPHLFPAFGLALPLGFELGPGQAYSLSAPWEAMGFAGATDVGLTLAALGFIVGSVGGVILINRGVKYKWFDEKYIRKVSSRGVSTGFLKKDEPRPEGSRQTTESDAIDSLSYHFALVFATYLLSYGILKLIEFLLSFLGGTGVQLSTSLWGVNFVFSVFVAVLVRTLLMKCGIAHTVDNGTMTRINGLSVDLTVAASLGAITLASLRGYWIPVVLLTALGIFIACIVTPFFCSRMFSDHKFFRMLMIFGTATGTLSTALSLIRVVDPEFET
ncbi:MAG: sodium:glutamate symporter, partial [Spirochaetales bacterium]|nr:sodium:glutamate symporter [Candidatus Physcosoma equi]